MFCLPFIYAIKKFCNDGDAKLGKNRCRSYCCISGDLKITEPEWVKKCSKDEIVAAYDKRIATRNRTMMCLIGILKELDRSEEEEETRDK
jgi:hypothetical protein